MGALLVRHYAWDYRVLRTFARHCTTGEVIPEKLVEAMNSARNMFAATEMQRQVQVDIHRFHVKTPSLLRNLVF